MKKRFLMAIHGEKAVKEQQEKRGQWHAARLCYNQPQSILFAAREEGLSVEEFRQQLQNTSMLHSFVNPHNPSLIADA